MDVAPEELVAAIYTGAFEFPFHQFKERALELVELLIPFTSAAWGTGFRSTNTMLTVATRNLPAERMLDYGLRWQDKDFVRAAALANPGEPVRIEDAMPLDRYRETDIYLGFSRPSGIEYSMATAHADPLTDIAELVCLFRGEAASAFAQHECAWMRMLMPHLGRAWQHRQIIYELEASIDSSAGKKDACGYAVVDAAGLVQAANLQFTAAIQRMLPDWHGPALPGELLSLTQVSAAQGRFGDHRVRITSGGDRYLIALAPMHGDQLLTPAEERVARLFASGKSSLDIAGTLGVSNSTVRNQLASIYRKLEIHSKAELARRIPLT